MSSTSPQGTTNAAGTGAPAQSGPTGSGAVTSNGQAASGQGGGNGAAPAAGSAAGKNPAGGQYTNFNSYVQNNQQAGGRLNNLLSNSFNQQSQQVGNTLNNTNSVAQGVQSTANQLNQSLQNVTGAVNNALTTGNYSGFSSFLDPNSNTAPTSGTQAAASSSTPGSSPSNPGGQASLSPSMAGVTGTAIPTTPTAQTNPVYQNLATPYQNLATGTTNQANLQSQANNLYNAANTNIGKMTTNQKLLTQQGGVGSLLSSLLNNANYTQGANNLDQALVTGNSANYSNIINNAGNQVNNAQNNLSNVQNTLNSQISGLGITATADQAALQPILQQGLTGLNTALTSQAATAEQQRQANQLNILNQFNTDTFNQSTANQLGLGNGAMLLDVLKNNGQNYNITNANQLASFNNTPYLTLNQATVGNADVINQDQLGAYAALQKLNNNNDASNYAYNQIGNAGTGYTVNSKAFDQALAAQYNNIGSTNLTATGQFGNGQTATANANMGAALGPAVIAALQQQAANNSFGALNTPVNTANLFNNTSLTVNPSNNGKVSATPGTYDAFTQYRNGYAGDVGVGNYGYSDAAPTATLNAAGTGLDTSGYAGGYNPSTPGANILNQFNNIVNDTAKVVPDAAGGVNLENNSAFNLLKNTGV